MGVRQEESLDGGEACWSGGGALLPWVAGEGLQSRAALRGPWGLLPPPPAVFFSPWAERGSQGLRA